MCACSLRAWGEDAPRLSTHWIIRKSPWLLVRDSHHLCDLSLSGGYVCFGQVMVRIRYYLPAFNSASEDVFLSELDFQVAKLKASKSS